MLKIPAIVEIDGIAVFIDADCFVRPWLNGLVAIGSRMPCAAEVG